MKLYESLSKESLEIIINNSLTYTEVLRKIGYKEGASKSIVEEISEKYNISIKHLRGRVKDLRGNHYGKLEVIEMDKTRIGSSGQTYWICQCECGGVKSIRGTDLTAGKTKSCGCLISGKSLNKNIVGKKFGQLTILRIFKDENNKTLLECQCDCGKKCIKSKISVCNGHTSSCGCLVSKGENKIEEILQNLNIKYDKQKKFEDLIGKSKPLPFDFYLPDYNTCIEYQGEQHYTPMRFSNGEEKFKERQIYDDKKRKYCNKNNIKLIEIPYWDFDKLDKDYLLSKF